MNDMLTVPDRPTSVTFVVVLSFVSAALYLVLIVMLSLTSIADFDSGGSPISNWPLIPARERDIASIRGLLGLSMAFSFLIGVGLSAMRRWVRVVGSVGYLLLAIWQLFTIFNTTYYSNWLMIGPVLSIIFVGVLNSRAVKQAFN
ncbi:MAG: hypothetical protein M3441_18255 [Chloroflexota bacterium]|nr:hypothetical protein [Chloroflexota bacterium]